jgi:hypothetical protein
MDETKYLINLATVPGHTPKPLSTLTSNPSSPTRTPSRTPMRTPLKFLDFTPAGKMDQSFVTGTPLDQSSLSLDTEDKENVVPAADAPGTPNFLHPKELVQRTCPPKQTSKSLFSFNGPQTPFRNRLVAAKRNHTDIEPKTCPPKQTEKSPFNLSGYKGPVTPFRQRLMSAKRRSTELEPATASPVKRMKLF